ncbi:unnamed protein product [Rhizophagus irregularis]|uniref:Uncharacterized protein n=1 Tax=Rhizophagus irregularis TaxID=588596 RepID=A0A2N1NJY6_9GLOM|nr:hypothetical protein RhiirC2_864014 [Rhizophagus irregularis]CAB4387374.1 unnamed protein product [Rhizophagus irregularis]CAB5374925.1 unnamed protein product [Rhizophagus irregularis]
MSSKGQYYEYEQQQTRGSITGCCGCIWTPILTLCGVFCCLVVISLVIIAVILGVNVNVCGKLSQTVDINTVTPSVHTYDPKNFPILNFISFNSILTKTGQIYVTQSNSTSDTNVSVSVRVVATKDETTSIKEENADSTKKIFLERADTFKGSLAWIGYFSLPPRCVLAKVEVVLPQTIPSVITIDTDVNDIVFYANPVPYSSQIIAKTVNGEIDVNNFAVGSLTLNTNNGGITGSVSEIVNELIAITNNGGIQLNVSISSNATNPKIEITNSLSDIQLNFNSSFSGSYDAKTDYGKVNIDNPSSVAISEDKKKTGKVGDKNGTLNANTKNGNININF